MQNLNPLTLGLVLWCIAIVGAAILEWIDAANHRKGGPRHE